MNWKNGCVAILKDKDEPIGTGFVVASTGIIVTCSHLLRPQPDNTILIRFTANNEIAQAKVIEEWSRGRDEDDVAFLRFTGPLPHNIPALPLANSQPVLKHIFHSWGYPRITDYDGASAKGDITGHTRKKGIPDFSLVPRK